MASPEQQALIALQTELRATRDQVLEITQRYDGLAVAHQTLSAETARVFQIRAGEMATLEQQLKSLLLKQRADYELLDLKSMRPEKYKGTRAEPWKPWARRFKAYCNDKAAGFRAAEAHSGAIRDFTSCPWDKGFYADAKLHDFLCATLGGEAVLVPELPGLEGQGFECWRRLTVKYSPNGGQHEIDAMMALMAPKPARDLAGLGGAIAKFEHDWRQYEKLSGETLPDKLKIGALLKILPPAQASDIKWKFAGGLTSYSAMTEHIETYSQHIRMEGAFARGDNDVDMGSLDLDSYLAIAPSEEKAAFWEGMAAGMSPDAEPPPPPAPHDEPLDALFKKGKGKGKGKSKGFSSGGKGGDDRRASGETRTCNWCQIKGHVEADCRNKAAGKPRREKGAGKGRPMKSLESWAAGQDDWVRESQESGRDRDLGNLERSCRTFDADLQLEELLGDEWVDEEEETNICADSHVLGSTVGGEDQI